MEQNSQNQIHLMGVFLVVISAIVFSSAGVFTKGVEAGAWDVVFWRGVFAAGFTTCYVLWQGRFSREFLEMGKIGWAVAILGASGTAAFIPALKMTSITNVALIYASAPLIAAVLAWLWIGERLGLKLLGSCVVAFLGVVVVVWGGTGGAASLNGDLLALWMTVVIAALMVVYRRFPKTVVAGPAAMSSILLLPIAVFLGEAEGGPLSLKMVEITILAAFGLVFAIASVTLFEGARRLPAAQTALLSGLELPFAVAFGWLFFAEIPVAATLIGGAMIVVGVLSSQLQQ